MRVLLSSCVHWWNAEAAYAAVLAEELLGAGHQAMVWTQPGTANEAELLRRGLPLITTIPPVGKNPLRWPATLAGLADLQRRERIEIVDVFRSAEFPLHLLAARHAPKPRVVRTRGSARPVRGGWLNRKMYGEWGAGLIAASGAVCSQMGSALHLPRERIHTIYYPIDLPTMQKFINFHYSVSVDLFGGEISTNGANFFNNGLKGRYLETRIKDDHRLSEAAWPVESIKDNRIVTEDQPALLAVNERLRDDYIADSQRGVDRWNKEMQQLGIDFELTLTHRAFNRRIGAFRDVRVTPGGSIISEEEWARRRDDWLPTEDDHSFVASLMKRVIEPGKMAGWIAPPARGINGRPLDFEYVKSS